MAWAVDYLGTPPGAGGVLNQNVKLINDMRAARNVYAAFESMLTTDMDQDKWSKAYPGHWKIVAKVQRLRMEMKRGNNRS